MEIPRSDWERYIRKLAAINNKAAGLMQKWIEANGYGSAEDMIAFANGLTQRYGEASAALACEMYDAIAAASGVTVEAAVPAYVVPEGYVAKAVQEKLTEAPTEIPALVGRMVKQANADTMLRNADRDGAQFAWIPHGDTCAFCIMLASRGWQHQSEKAMKNGHAEHIHSNCDCEYCVRFDAKTSVAGYDPQKYADMYYSADGNTPQEKINAMRREQYAKEKAVEKSLESDIIRGSKNFKTVVLPKQEYAHVMSEIATHLTDEQKEKTVFKKAVGKYVYTVENNGFGDYRIIGKKEIR